jgi:hypothetical protein
MERTIVMEDGFPTFSARAKNWNGNGDSGHSSQPKTLAPKPTFRCGSHPCLSCGTKPPSKQPALLSFRTGSYSVSASPMPVIVLWSSVALTKAVEDVVVKEINMLCCAAAEISGS